MTQDSYQVSVSFHWARCEHCAWSCKHSAAAGCDKPVQGMPLPQRKDTSLSVSVTNDGRKMIICQMSCTLNLGL